MFQVTVDSRMATQKINKISLALGGRGDLFRPAMRAMAVYVLSQYFQRNFSQQGKLTAPWKEIHWVTALLRPKGRSRLYSTIDEVKGDIAAGKYKTLRDTGMLLGSFIPMAGNNVFRTSGQDATAGTADHRAEKLHRGFTIPAGSMTKEKIAKIVARFRKKADKSPVYAALHGMNKKAHQVVPRQLRHDAIPAEWRNRVVRVGIKEVGEILRREFRPTGAP